MQEPVFSSAPIDRLGISRHGMAITEKSRVLLVLGRSDTDLQNHANELLTWLRQARPKLHAEMVPAIEGEQLIQRFNDMLAGLSIEAAVRPDQPTPPERLWILRDDNQLREPEVRLLAKLQLQFPAARLSSVILTRHPERFSGLLQSDERGLLSWTLPGVSLAPPEDWLAEPAPSPPAPARRPAPKPPGPARRQRPPRKRRPKHRLRKKAAWARP